MEDLGGNRRVLNFDHPGNLQASMAVIKMTKNYSARIVHMSISWF